MSSPESASGLPARGGAVFLSYASQDAEAVRRIAEALRAAGVEVWFDQNELVGGDAWDQKIRGQIKACALFVPVISAATQARREGYFRLEWKLAAQRTHTMADGTPFLLPVVIDATRDGEALVPEEFRAVQWTRLRPVGFGGQARDEGVEKFCARVGKLLGGDAVAAGSEVDARPDRANEDGRGRASALRKPARAWLVPALLGVSAVAALAIWQPWRAKEQFAPSASPTAALTPSAPLTEAQQLVAKARKILDEGDEMNRETYTLAEELLKKAEAIDVTEASAWALHAQLSSDMVLQGFDRSQARREALRAQGSRAMKLAPASLEAALAAAVAQIRLGEDAVNALQKTQILAEKYPHDWRVWRMLGRAALGANQTDQGLAALDQALKLLPDDPRLKSDRVNLLHRSARFPEAEIALLQALKGRTCARLETLQIFLMLAWRGDLAGATAGVQQLPAWYLSEDRGSAMAGLVYLWAREPKKALASVSRFPRDYIHSSLFDGPRAVLTAWAHEAADEAEAAKADWQIVIQLTDRELGGAPDNGWALHWKAWALARLGRRDEADRILRLLRERNAGFTRQASTFDQYLGNLAGLAATVGRPDMAIEQLAESIKGRATEEGRINPTTKSILRLNPVFDPLRNDPRFQALIDAAPGPEEKKENTAAGATAPDKSVAVLAFANVGGDKENEVFSDGISEELINVLGRVPGLTVKGRASSFFFKGSAASAQEKGQKLGATYLVDGSVRRQGNAVRITAQLSRAATDEVVWSSEPLVRELKDMWAVQEEIAGLIAKALSLKLGVASAASKTEVDPEAFRLYIEGRREWNRRLPASYIRAEQFLTRAIQLAPRFAQAHAALADVWELQGEWDNELGPYDQRDGSLARRVRAKAREALAIDPQSAEAHASLGLVGWNSWRFAEGEEALRTAVRINPSYASAHQWLGRNLMMQGRLEEALAALGRAAELDPLSPRILDNLAWALVHAGRTNEALAALDRALGLQPDALQAMSIKARILARQGRRDESMALLKAVPADVWISSHWRVTALGFMGDAEARSLLESYLNDRNAVTRFTALLLLGREEEALRNLVPGQIEATRADVLLFDSIFDRVRGDARFMQALAAIGLTEAHARAQAWRAGQGKR